MPLSVVVKKLVLISNTKIVLAIVARVSYSRKFRDKKK